MIPTRRLIGLGSMALLLVLVGQGAPWSVTSAWFLFGLAGVAWIFDTVLAARQSHRLEFRRRTPMQLYVEQWQSVEWSIENRDLRPVLLQLRDQTPESGTADPDRLQTLLPVRSRITVGYRLRVSQRGFLTFGNAICRIRGPLGLSWRQFHVSAVQPIRSLPHLANWRAAQLATRKALMRQAGSHRYRWRGAGTQFESLRDYSPEDDIRWLDWKATARTQRPITRNYEVERHQHVMLLVDSSRMMTTYCGLRTKFDAVLEAAVLLTRATLDQGDALGLVLFSDKVDAYVAPRRDRTQNTVVMETLFARYPRLVEADFETALTVVSQRIRRRSLLILFTDLAVLEAAQRMLAYVQLVSRRHLCLIVTIADENVQQQKLLEPRTADELYRVGVASQLILERAELLERLRRSGAEIVDSPADQITSRTIERYLQLKRKMRL